MNPGNPINIPPGSDVHMLAGDGIVIMIAPPGSIIPMSALLTHDEDVSWPDATGVALANEVLAAGHPVMLGFTNPRDAQACLARIMRGAAH